MSTLTNFSMDDCFHDGSTKRECFNVKDGRQIGKAAKALGTGLDLLNSLLK